MSKGRLRCIGSSLFLKNRYGVGYNLTIAKKAEEEKEETKEVDIEGFVSERIPSYKLFSCTTHEITFQLPFKESECFKVFFEELDSNLEKLQIESYGISVTTLEEVFLRVAKGDEENTSAVERKMSIKRSSTYGMENIKELDKYSIANSYEKGKCNTFCIHFAAIFLKRLIHTKRNYLTLLVEIFIPVLLVIFALALTTIQIFVEADPRWFEYDSYPTPQKFMINQDCVTFDGMVLQDFQNQMPSEFEAIQVLIGDGTSSCVNDFLGAFDTELFDNRNINPSRYGSIFLHNMNKASHKYEVTIFSNLSSQDSSTAFTNYFIEGLIKTATD